MTQLLAEVMAARNEGGFTDDQGKNWTLRRTPAVETNKFREMATPKAVQNTRTVQTEKPEMDFRQFKAFKVAYALVEPALDGEKIEERVRSLNAICTQLEIDALFGASVVLDDMTLTKVGAEGPEANLVPFGADTPEGVRALAREMGDQLQKRQTESPGVGVAASE